MRDNEVPAWVYVCTGVCTCVYRCVHTATGARVLALARRGAHREHVDHCLPSDCALGVHLWMWQSSTSVHIGTRMNVLKHVLVPLHVCLCVAISSQTQMGSDVHRQPCVMCRHLQADDVHAVT